MGPARHILGAVAVLLMAAALALLGPARPAPALGAQAPDLSAYALPDGTIPDICGLDPGQGPHGEAHCPACLAGKALPTMTAPALAPRALVPAGFPLACRRPAPRARRRARAPPARAPPPPTAA